MDASHIRGEDLEKDIRAFVDYAKRLDGDEKGEAQVFIDRFFQAFGHGGYKEAGATLEERVRKKDKRVGFADLVWGQRLLLEMKKRTENLQKHYNQVRDYWFNLFPKPQYVILCNFDEFWIYDFDVQHDPVDKLKLEELPERYEAFGFMFPKPRKPLFENNRIEVTRNAAEKVARAFNSLIQRGEDRDRARHFVLQCVIAMFAEDTDLLPRGLFTELVYECRKDEISSYDLLGGLVRQMSDPRPARGGRFQGVKFFNGGLFREIDPFELLFSEAHFLHEAAMQQWRKVQPEVFGTLFQSIMGKEERHASGAHFTHEADVQKIVQPTIVRPWRERIEATDTLTGLLELRDELLRFRVLDPACGSGNFLYVTFRELKRLEIELLGKIGQFSVRERTRRGVNMTSRVNVRQMFGIDHNPFAVELAKVTLTIAKELALHEAQETAEADLTLTMFESALPLDDLDENVVCGDALFIDWPQANAVIGNPPFQSKNKMQQEFGPAYVNRVRARYPEVPGRADYCVYWLRRTHDELKPGQRAGLVGTNTIRQNESREGGLDYIVDNGGTITEAVSSQVWSGDAAVHVSIVNWIKGEAEGPKKLFRQVGDLKDSPFEAVELDYINPVLSDNIDVRKAKTLRVNKDAEACYQGQTHGHSGFLLSSKEAVALLKSDSRNTEVIFPYMTFNDMLTTNPPRPKRNVIDFHPRDVFAAAKYKGPFSRVKEKVLPDRKEKAHEEKKRNEKTLAANSKARVNRHHQNFFKTWWLLSYPREEMISKIVSLPRFSVCGQVTKRPIFEFVNCEIRPNAQLMVFPLPDDYSFGVLHSNVHWQWFIERCSTLKRDFRYTSTTVFDSFPWPQEPTLEQVRDVAEAAVALRKLRCEIMQENSLTLRALYRMLEELPGQNPLADVHARLDAAVRAAYGMKPGDNVLAFLLQLNHQVAERQDKGESVVAPGLPPCVNDSSTFITEDCIHAPKLAKAEG
ncbi:MAG: DNA methyltransferase [Candidatus Binatia bacterium]